MGIGLQLVISFHGVYVSWATFFYLSETFFRNYFFRNYFFLNLFFYSCSHYFVLDHRLCHPSIKAHVAYIVEELQQNDT